MTEPKPVYKTAVSCPGCVDVAVALVEAQTAIVAMMNECGLRQVTINVDEKYNRFWIVGQHRQRRFTQLDELYVAHKPEETGRQVGMFEEME
jgi:hypothetical protein